ncbi:uncharacterized protein METZ01_LOCUS358159, partial [marine metagenome]
VFFLTGHMNYYSVCPFLRVLRCYSTSLSGVAKVYNRTAFSDEGGAYRLAGFFLRVA